MLLLPRWHTHTHTHTHTHLFSCELLCVLCQHLCDRSLCIRTDHNFVQFLSSPQTFANLRNHLVCFDQRLIQLPPCQSSSRPQLTRCFLQSRPPGLIVAGSERHWSWGAYMMSMSAFHASEYFMTALHNHKSLSVDSFLLNHSRS